MGLTIKTEIEGINITITKDAVVKLLTSIIKSEEEQEKIDEEEYTEEPETEEEEEQVQNEKKILLFDDSITDAIARTKAKAKSVFTTGDANGMYKGFLLIRCDDCGSVKGFCAKQPIDRFRCDDCGGTTKLRDLRCAFQECTCGRTFKYKTNEKSDVITNNCIECGKPVDMMLNANRTAYTTIK